jgi:ribosomal protein S18 acetylase RimI-like enzyme
LKNAKGEVVAGVGLTPSDRRDDVRRIWYIDWFALAQEYQGKGLGRDLIEIAERRTRAMGIEWLNVYTSTSPQEAAANALYEKSGFRVIEEKPAQNADGSQVMDLFRQKHLAP